MSFWAKDNSGITDWTTGIELLPGGLAGPAGPTGPAGNGVPTGLKVYRALLTQAAGGAPTATVLENTLGGTVVWTRSSAGIYLGTLAGAFPAAKTFLVCQVRGVGDGDIGTTLTRVSDNAVQVGTYSVDIVGQAVFRTDDALSRSAVEILVYP